MKAVDVTDRFARYVEMMTNFFRPRPASVLRKVQRTERLEAKHRRLNWRSGSAAARRRQRRLMAKASRRINMGHHPKSGKA